MTEISSNYAIGLRAFREVFIGCISTTKKNHLIAVIRLSSNHPSQKCWLAGLPSHRADMWGQFVSVIPISRSFQSCSPLASTCSSRTSPPPIPHHHQSTIALPHPSSLSSFLDMPRYGSYTYLIRRRAGSPDARREVTARAKRRVSGEIGSQWCNEKAVGN